MFRVGWNWANATNPRLTRQHLRDWAALAPRLEDAIASARRLNADEALARLSRARAQLSGSLPEHLAGTGVVRLPTLESQLAA